MQYHHHHHHRHHHHRHHHHRHHHHHHHHHAWSGPIPGSQPSVECRDETSGDTLSVLGPSPTFTIKANSQNIENKYNLCNKGLTLIHGFVTMCFSSFFFQYIFCSLSRKHCIINAFEAAISWCGWSGVRWELFLVFFSL